MKFNIKRNIKYAKPYKIHIALAMVMSIIIAFCKNFLTWMIKFLEDDVFKKKDSDMLFAICIGLVVITVLQSVVSYLKQWLTGFIVWSLVNDIRKELYAKIQQLPMAFFSKIRTGEMVSIFNNDTLKFQGIVSDFFSLVQSIVTLGVALATIFYLNWRLSLFVLIFIPVLSLLVRIFAKHTLRRGKDILAATLKFSGYLQEAISGIRVIKSFNTENDEIKKFNEISIENSRANIRSDRTKAKVSPAMEFFNAISLVMIIWWAGIDILAGKMTAGGFMAFFTALIVIYEPIKQILNVNSSISGSMASANKIFEILDTKSDIYDKPDASELHGVEGSIKFKNVCFKYEKDGKEILKNINLSVNAGENIAIVGKSGGGKTTFVNLIPRFYDVTEGELFVDGYNIKDVTMESLRKNIALVLQDNFLFSGSIYDNITYGKKDAAKEEVIAAAKLANVLEFTDNLREGLDTEVGERGVLLSGGQKQRIAIARAILRNPRILILDEATSALDNESERYVQESLDSLMKGRTTFVIAHRLSTIVNADRIIVMDEGEIKEIGTHDELIRENGIYKTLYEKQFS